MATRATTMHELIGFSVVHNVIRIFACYKLIFNQIQGYFRAKKTLELKLKG